MAEPALPIFRTIDEFLAWEERQEERRPPVALPGECGHHTGEHQRPADVVAEDVVPGLIVDGLAAAPLVDLVHEEPDPVEVGGDPRECDRPPFAGGKLPRREGDEPAGQKMSP